MKRICFLIDSIFSIGGVQRVTAVIAKELAKDYDVTIVTFDNPDDVDYNLYELNEAPIHYQFIKYANVSRIKGFIYKAHRAIYLFLNSKSKWQSKIYAITSFPSEQRKTILTALKSENYNTIIGVHAQLAERLASLRHDLPNAKLIGWLHNSFEAIFKKNSLYIGHNKQFHFIQQFKKLDEFIVLCHYDALQFTNYDESFKPIVIYNPITLNPGPKTTGNTKKFLAVGRFSYLHKGFDILINAFHLFCLHNSDWNLDIVGEGDLEEEYKELIRKLNCEDRIHIHPFTNHIQDYYSNAQVYVLSSRWEGMPLVLVEAMSHGLPVISSDLPVCKEILGDFGLFFKNEDAKSLAQRLEDATHIEWKTKSEQALGIANQFKLEPIIKEWKNIIES